MIQNHVMQLFAYYDGTSLFLNPEAIRDEKVKALQAVKPLSWKILLEVVRVYSEGLVGGRK